MDFHCKVVLLILQTLSLWLFLLVYSLFIFSKFNPSHCSICAVVSHQFSIIVQMSALPLLLLFNLSQVCLFCQKIFEVLARMSVDALMAGFGFGSIQTFTTKQLIFIFIWHSLTFYCNYSRLLNMLDMVWSHQTLQLFYLAYTMFTITNGNF